VAELLESYAGLSEEWAEVEGLLQRLGPAWAELRSLLNELSGCWVRALGQADLAGYRPAPTRARS
jgi:hypothetical protein